MRISVDNSHLVAPQLQGSLQNNFSHSTIQSLSCVLVTGGPFIGSPRSTDTSCNVAIISSTPRLNVDVSVPLSIKALQGPIKSHSPRLRSNKKPRPSNILNYTVIRQNLWHLNEGEMHFVRIRMHERIISFIYEIDILLNISSMCQIVRSVQILMSSKS